MEPPPASRQASPPVSTAVPPHLNHPDSVDDAGGGGGGSKLRLMCSYGGHIVPRPHDRSLCYVGGDTRIFVADRRTTLADLTARLSKTLLGGRSFALKYQLPGEDLDSLVSVTTDEDLENMIDEYDRTANFPRPSRLRLRLFLFPSIGEGSAGSEGWFSGSAGLDRGFSDSASVNCLLGLDDGAVLNPNPTARGNVAVADSPLLETTSSFGSASSSSSLANLPPIRVHVGDGGAAIATGLRIQDQKLGIEEQFAQIGVSTGQKQNEGFVVHSSPPNTIAAVPVSSMLIGGEYANWVVSDDERSDHGVPVVYIKQPIQQLQSQPQQKPNGGIDLASPDSVSSDGSIANPLSRGKPVVYQEQLVQIPLVTSRVNANPVDQVAREPGYVLQPQFDQQQQQFVHPGGHYIQHHQRGVPIQAYYQVYHPHQQQYNPQYQPVYYMPARPGQAYNISEAPASTPSSLPQTPPSPAMAQSPTSHNPMMSPPVAKQEIAAGMYRTTTTPPQMVQVPSSHHQQRQQYIGFTQMQYPSQSVAPASNYAYEYVEPAHAPMYYTQPLAPTMSAAQYQTMLGAGAVVLPDGSAQHPKDGIKQHIRTSQAM